LGGWGVPGKRKREKVGVISGVVTKEILKIRKLIGSPLHGRSKRLRGGGRKRGGGKNGPGGGKGILGVKKKSLGHRLRLRSAGRGRGGG